MVWLKNLELKSADYSWNRLKRWIEKSIQSCALLGIYDCLQTIARQADNDSSCVHEADLHMIPWNLVEQVDKNLFSGNKMKRCQSLHDPIIHSRIVQKTNSDREPDLSKHANNIVLLWINTHLSSENQEMKCSDLKSCQKKHRMHHVFSDECT